MVKSTIHPVLYVRKIESTKVDVFGLKFGPNISTFVESWHSYGHILKCESKSLERLTMHSYVFWYVI